MSKPAELPPEDVPHLQERVRKLGREKSYLQLVNNLMSSLSAVPGLENTVDAIVQILLDNLGGLNVALYYLIDSAIHYVDVYGEQKVVTVLEDALVRRALETREFVEELHDFHDTRMTTPAFGKASYWALPLLVGTQLVGVLKMEGMLLSADEIRGHLQPFFSYAALILRNEIRGYSQLTQAYDELRAINEALTQEIDDRFAQQQFLEAVLENTEAGIVACDERGTLTLLNRKARDLHRLPLIPPAAEAWAEHYPLYQPDGRTPKSKEDIPLFRALRGERVANVEMLIRTEGQPPRTLLASGQRIIGKEDQSLGAVVVMHDITERKNMEVQLRQSQKLEAIGQLAAGIAHEINTPAQFVGDNARFLRDAFGELLPLLRKYQALRDSAAQGGLTTALAQELKETEEVLDLPFLVEEIPKALRQSLEGLEQVASIVRSMKEFAHAGSQGSTEVDINQAIETTVTIARNEWKQVAEMVLDLASGLPRIRCSLSDLNQVLLNMVVNAAQAVAEAVASRPGHKGTIGIATRCLASVLELRISDTGAGIRPEHQAHIFEPFFTTKSVGKGSGMGLSICHAIVVERHHGTISVESEVGRGTTFCIRLPRSDAAGAEAVSQVGSESPPACPSPC